MKQNTVDSVLERYIDNNISLYRTGYYTEISFSANDEEITYPFRVDTGSPVTIIGSELVDDIIQIPRKSVTNVHAMSVSGQDLNIAGIIVDNFKVCDEILIPKIEIFISNCIGKHALLGADILSLFDISYYRKEKTIHISMEKDLINNLMLHMQKLGKDYLAYSYIATLEVDKII